MGRGRGQIICYNFAQPGHLARDCQNLVPLAATATHLNMLLNIVPCLLAKLQERRGGNPQVQLISTEPHRVDPRVIFITRGGASIGEDRMTPRKTTNESGSEELQRRHQSLIRGKKRRYLKRQEENLEEIRLLHQRHN
jgi:hypothetical protein